VLIYLSFLGALNVEVYIFYMDTDQLSEIIA